MKTFDAFVRLSPRVRISIPNSKIRACYMINADGRNKTNFKRKPVIIGRPILQTLASSYRPRDSRWRRVRSCNPRRTKLPIKKQYAICTVIGCSPPIFKNNFRSDKNGMEIFYLLTVKPLCPSYLFIDVVQI